MGIALPVIVSALVLVETASYRWTPHAGNVSAKAPPAIGSDRDSAGRFAVPDAIGKPAICALTLWSVELTAIR